MRYFYVKKEKYTVTKLKNLLLIDRTTKMQGFLGEFLDASWKSEI